MSNIDHPSHYSEGRKYEPIKVIQDWDLDFCLGNTVKYISRAGRKSSAAMSDIDKEIEDLKKAKFYLDYKINELEEEKNNGDQKLVNAYVELIKNAFPNSNIKIAGTQSNATENPYQE